jgi:uncharacterized membrane protein
MRNVWLVIAGIIVLSFAIGAYLYPYMPDQMAGHWNAAGQADGYISKFWGLFLMPLISLAMAALFAVIPRIDPLKANIRKFRSYFNGFIVMMMLFLFYLYVLTLLWSAGYMFDMTRMLIPAFAALFYYCGVLIDHAKMNWFIGIRTPWTMSSEVVWNKTHKVGGKLFKLSGEITLIGVFLPGWAIWFALVPVVLTAIYVFVYSYLEFKKLPGKKRRRRGG